MVPGYGAIQVEILAYDACREEITKAVLRHALLSPMVSSWYCADKYQSDKLMMAEAVCG